MAELDLLSRLELELATTLSALKVENDSISQQESEFKLRERKAADDAAAAATATLARESDLTQRVNDLTATLAAARQEQLDSTEAYTSDRAMQEEQLRHQRLLTSEFERQVRVLGDELGASSETLAKLQRQHTLLLRELRWRDEREAAAEEQASLEAFAAAQQQRRALEDKSTALRHAATTVDGSNAMGHKLAAELFAARDALHAHFARHVQLDGVPHEVPLWAQPLIGFQQAERDAPAPFAAAVDMAVEDTSAEQQQQDTQGTAFSPTDVGSRQEATGGQPLRFGGSSSCSGTAFSPTERAEEDAAWLALSTASSPTGLSSSLEEEEEEVEEEGGATLSSSYWGAPLSPPSPSAEQREEEEEDFARATLRTASSSDEASQQQRGPYGLSPITELSISLRRREEATNTPAGAPKRAFAFSAGAAAAAAAATAVETAAVTPLSPLGFEPLLHLDLNVVEEELGSAFDGGAATDNVDLDGTPALNSSLVHAAQEEEDEGMPCEDAKKAMMMMCAVSSSSPELALRLLSRPPSRRGRRSDAMMETDSPGQPPYTPPAAFGPLPPPPPPVAEVATAAMTMVETACVGVGQENENFTAVDESNEHFNAQQLPTKSVRPALTKKQRAQRVKSAYGGTKTRVGLKKGEKKKRRGGAGGKKKQKKRGLGLRSSNSSNVTAAAAKAAKGRKSRNLAKTSRLIYTHTARMRTASASRRALR